MRVLSLVAGIALLVTGLASTIESRRDVADARDERLESTADLLTEQLDATVTRATAALGVATADTTIERLAGAVGLPVCAVADGDRACTSDIVRLVPQRSVDAAVEAAAGHADPVAVVVPDSLRAVVALDQGERVVLVAADVDASTLPTGITARLVPVAAEPLLAARTSGTQRMFATPSLVEFDDGPWAVRTATADAVRLTAGERWLLGGQMAIGALLAVFALGGILAEHRSLQRRATTDALTQLPNRDAFERRATETLARLGRDRGTACLLVIDLDQFKVVNDTVGHEAGDRALVAAAERLRDAVRETDLVGRWGGDEFVVLMPGIVDPRAIPERAAMIANAIAASPPIGAFELTASIGAALFPAHGKDLETLLRAADRAMYAAKVQGVAHHVAEGV